MSKAYDRIQQERRLQDATWGGTAHDDQHSINYDFANFINNQLHALYDTDYSHYEEQAERLIKIAALCVAAYDVLDRKGVL